MTCQWEIRWLKPDRRLLSGRRLDTKRLKNDEKCYIFRKLYSNWIVNHEIYEISQIWNLENHFAGCVWYEKKHPHRCFFNKFFCWGWPSWTTIGLAWIVWLMNSARTRAFQERLSDRFQLFFFVEMFEIISQRIGDVWCICMYLPTFAWIFLGTVGKYTMHGSSWILRGLREGYFFFALFFFLQ